MISLLTELESAKVCGHRIDVVQRSFHGKTVNLTKKGGTPWETKAEKKIKTKLKNKKPTNRLKKTKRNSRGAFYNGSGGLRLSEAHTFPSARLLKMKANPSYTETIHLSSFVTLKTSIKLNVFRKMNGAKTNVVIDKSFLQGAPKDTLQLLFTNHRVLMCAVNFYELLTTKPIERTRCFQRMPQGENPVALVEPSDFIWQWEVENQRPLLDIRHAIRQEPFHFNSGLINETLLMEEDQTKHLKNLQGGVSRKVKAFAEHCSQITIRFPELGNYRPGGIPSEIEEIQKRICTDPEYVREFYNGGRGHTWPPADHIDEQWALFTWIQIRLVAALDYFRKYGESKMSSETTKIENEYLDLEYCLIGCLVGSIATQDKGMAKRFLTLRPSGNVFPDNI
jgi:hypothetical protein